MYIIQINKHFILGGRVCWEAPKIWSEWVPAGRIISNRNSQSEKQLFWKQRQVSGSDQMTIFHMKNMKKKNIFKISDGNSTHLILFAVFW